MREGGGVAAGEVDEEWKRGWSGEGGRGGEAGEEEHVQSSEGGGAGEEDQSVEVAYN